MMGVNETEPSLRQIGEFSRLTKISVRMIRHYQDRGLLLPAWTDPFTGYRFYGRDQLVLAIRIRELRDAGLSIERIGMVIETDDSERIIEILECHARELAEKAHLAERQIASVSRLIEAEGETKMELVVTEKTRPAQIRAALRRVIPSYSDEGELWGTMMPLLQETNLTWGPETSVGASFFDPDYKESDCDVQIWMTVPQQFEAVAPLECVEVPEHKAISVTVTGPYDEVIYAATDALARYAEDHDLATGLMYNVYVVGPGSGVSPDQYVTEVCTEIL